MSNTTNTLIKRGKGKLLKYWLLVVLVCIGSIAPAAQALTMSNANYTLHMGNMDTVTGKSTNSSYQLNQSLGQTAPGLYSGANYTVRSGFQYVLTSNKFRFTVSPTVIDFGTLSATNPVTRTQTLTINSGSAKGYSVTAAENHSLLFNEGVPAAVPFSGTMAGKQIPNTTCDSGTCSETTAGAWTSSLTYGFGYSLDTVNYKQFADISNNKTAQVVMSGSNTGKSVQAQITYKVNIATTQLPGLYSNQVTYIALPGF